MNKTYIAFIFSCLAIPFNVFAGEPAGAVYLSGPDSKRALILAHGKGKHPTWLVVDPVRKAVNSKLGYHTISLKMPTGYDNWKEYVDGFPMAYDAIEQAVAFLKHEKGVTQVYLFGHSMGGRMSSAYIYEIEEHGLAGLIVAGCRNNGGQLLSCEQNLRGANLPILDIWGGDNGKDVEAASARKDMVSDSYTQVKIPGANHKFEGYEDELVNAVSSWLEKQI